MAEMGNEFQSRNSFRKITIMVKIGSRIWYVKVKWMLKPCRIRGSGGGCYIRRHF